MADEQFFTLAGHRAVSGRINFRLQGPWHASIVLAGDVVPAEGKVAIKVGDTELSGAIRVPQSGAFGGKASALVVGGAGGWSKVIPSRAYALNGGVKVSAVLEDAARDAGEQISVANGNTLVGPNWCRKQGRASRVLRLLLDGAWWVDDAGVTQTGARDDSKIASPFTVIEYSPMLGRYEIATENYRDWRPGRRFQSLTMPAEAKISSVTLEAKDGKIRVFVLDSATAEERLLKEIRSIIRDEVSRLEHGTIVEYEITKAEEMLVDCRPTAGKASPWPALSKVKLKAGLLGETVTPTVGKKCLIVFLDNDPALYRCLGVEGPNESSKIETSGDIEAVAGGIFKVCGGGHFAALADIVMSNFSSLSTYLSTHTHGSGVGPTTPPLAPPPNASDVSSSKLRTD